MKSHQGAKNVMVRQLEQSVKHLLLHINDENASIKKETLYNRIGQYLLSSVENHWWCTYPDLMKFMIRIMELYPGPNSVQMFNDRMQYQLGICTECVDRYHSERLNVHLELKDEYTPKSVAAFFKILVDLDVERVKCNLFDVCQPLETLESGEKPMKIVAASTAIYELFSYRSLYSNCALTRVLSEWLIKVPENVRKQIETQRNQFRSCIGVYQLLVSPDPSIRTWATSLVTHYQQIVVMKDGLDHHLMQVLNEWMYIMECDMFQKPLLDLDLEFVQDLSMFLEPVNCIQSPTPAIIWAALDVIFQRVDEQNLDYILEHYENFPDLVLNDLLQAEATLQSQQITLMVCRCFTRLLECLRHLFWRHTIQVPSTVLPVLLQHCQQTQWKTFVLKQIVQILPLFIASTRHVGRVYDKSIGLDEEQEHFTARRSVLRFLVDVKHRSPAYNNDSVLSIAVSKAVSQLIRNGYETHEKGKSEGAKTSEIGALEEYFLAEKLRSDQKCHYFYELHTDPALESLWIDHLFDILVNPKHVTSLVDHIAATCAIVLKKHFQLAREAVYGSLLAGGEPKKVPLCAVHTKLLAKLGQWQTVASIPVLIHGTLFEILGGVAEIRNLLQSHSALLQSTEMKMWITSDFEAVENQICQYFTRMCQEILVNGLTNPFIFPVVAQHASMCLLHPSPTIEQAVQRLLIHADGKMMSVASTASRPTLLEAYLVICHRHPQAFLRSLSIYLSYLRGFNFAWSIAFPTLKKLLFLWIKIFELDGDTLCKAIYASQESLSKIPNLLNDFAISIIGTLAATPTDPNVPESLAVRVLDFTKVFWNFWSRLSEMKNASFGCAHKRNFRIFQPLIRWLSSCDKVVIKCRIVYIIRELLQICARNGVSIDNTNSQCLEKLSLRDWELAKVKGSELKDFTQLIKQVVQKPTCSSQGNDFFASTRALSPKKSGATSFFPKLPGMPKVVKQHRLKLKPLGGQSTEISEPTASTMKKNHSFYSEPQYAHANSTKSDGTSSKSDNSNARQFSMGKVLEDMSVTHHPLSIKPQPVPIVKKVDTIESCKAEEEPLDLVSVFDRVRKMQKGIICCSLLSFYRSALHFSLPMTLTAPQSFKSISNKTHIAPPLSFRNSAQYVDAFLPLLLEETASEVLETLQRAWYTSSQNVIRINSEKRREGMRCLYISIAREALEKKFNRTKIFRNGDLVLFRNASDASAWLGIVLITESDKIRKRTHTKYSKTAPKDTEDDLIKVLFLNDQDLELAAEDLESFAPEKYTSEAFSAVEWHAQPLMNLVTASREYVALRSVDLLPEYLRKVILSPESCASEQSQLVSIGRELEALKKDACSEMTQKSKIMELMNTLDETTMTLQLLRATGIGKIVNSYRKAKDRDVAARANEFKSKWTELLKEDDKLLLPPPFCSESLWKAVCEQYNSSQLQGIRDVVANYKTGVSLLQGPPGTGKTRTIMALLSCFLSIESTVHSQMALRKKKILTTIDADTNNSDRASDTRSTVAFLGTNGIRSCSGVLAKEPRTSIQKLTNIAGARDRLSKILNQSTSRVTPGNSFTARSKPKFAPRIDKASTHKCTRHVLLCAPSNGAVDELVLRIVSDGLMHPRDQIVSVQAPDVSSSNISDTWTIVRLGSAGQDAPNIVKDVCLQALLKKAIDAHPKTLQLQTVMADKVKFGDSIRAFHQSTDAGKNRKDLSKLHRQITECSGKIRRLRDEIRALESSLTSIILSKANIVACTLSKSGSGVLSALSHGFDALIIDEAAQAVELSTLIPVRERVARVILVGDPKQLPATVKSKAAASARYDRSLFERIVECGNAPYMLRVQYRMHPNLREFPSSRFYGGLLTDGAQVMENAQCTAAVLYKNWFFQPFLFYHLSSSTETDVAGSKCNYEEADFCTDLCSKIVEILYSHRERNDASTKPSPKQWSIGFISPYRGQVDVLRSRIRQSSLAKWLAVAVQKNVKNTASTNFTIEVNTVDGFQGREKDVIIFSCVRSSMRGGIGFLSDVRRLNVAITRARYCLFVVGDIQTLRRDRTWSAFVSHATNRKWMVNTKGKSFRELSAYKNGDTFTECDDLHRNARNTRHAKSRRNDHEMDDYESHRDVRIEDKTSRKRTKLAE